MKKNFILIAAVLITFPLLACSQNEPAQPTVKAATPAVKTAETTPAETPAPAAPHGISGTVVETMDAAGYTYVYVDDGKEKIWAAAPAFAVKVGDEVMVPEGMAMHNYHSQSMDRDFDVVYFVESVLNASNPTMGTPSMGSGMMGGGANPADMQMPKGHPAVSGSEAPQGVDLSDVKKAENGLTIAEIYAGKTDLSEKTVTLRGKVVKYSPQIMGVNWIHLQDGSGNQKAGTHDLTVTSQVEVNVGDTIVASGPLTLDKDFGYGYKYSLIMENADVTVE
ncbi:MAG: hypothetical protein KAH06_08180 [Desulfobacterales bacterium]|nr:hypothetical protein [Desulfobacterales bacterium]